MSTVPPCFDLLIGRSDTVRRMSNDRFAVARRIENRLFDEHSPHLDRFGALLVLTIASVAALSLIDLDAIDGDAARGFASFALSATTGATLVLALRAAGVVKRWRRGAEFLVVAAAVAHVVLLIVELTVDTDVAPIRSSRPSPIWVVITLLSPLAVLHRLLQHRRVSVQTLAGAVAAYLLIAMAGCYTFVAIDAVLDGGFFGVEVDSHEFMYFSLVTITTLGYGDLSPAEPIGRLAATTMAVLGQVYLVTFVAMVVGLFIQQRDGSES